MVIPLALMLGLFGHAVLPVSLELALLPASLVGLALLVDAVYLNPPTAYDGE